MYVYIEFKRPMKNISQLLGTYLRWITYTADMLIESIQESRCQMSFADLLVTFHWAHIKIISIIQDIGYTF